MANAARNIRGIFDDAEDSLTLTEIKSALPDLKSNQISMALCYFVKKGELTRQQVPNEKSKGRKNVWLYTHVSKLQKETT
jgi:hypothetical protein